MSASALSSSSSSPERSKIPTRSDAAMESTYDRLARRAIDLYRSKKGSGFDGQYWIGIAGGPGAGKSTLAEAVADRICQMQEKHSSRTIRAVSIPMDGYHYTRAKLSEISEKYPDTFQDGSKGMSRRGAPWTFDAARLADDLCNAKLSGSANLPEYSRVLSDPVEGAVQLEPSDSIVLVEGNYLLLGHLEAEVINHKDPLPGSNLAEACIDLQCPVPIGDEIRRWRETSRLWDESWFVSPPSENAVDIQRDRIIERSLETWTPAKTEAWGGKTDREAAVRRAEFNDVRNARLVNCCRTHADVIIESI